ncbi:MAG: TrkA C-terminal domain-containing protein, partial [Bacteroidia bacterium]
DSAFAVNRTLSDLSLDKIKVNVHTIRRGNDIVPNPRDDTQLLSGDIVILNGEMAAIEAAESFLLIGKK